MGGRGTGSGFRAGGNNPQAATGGRTIADGMTENDVRARMRIILGQNDLTSVDAQTLSNAGATARTWGRTASSIKRDGFTARGGGVWDFDADTKGGGNTEIGAQVLHETDGSYSMVAWTGADADNRRYFRTRAQAEKAARVRMQIRLSEWARAQRP